jgi:protein translocase SecG subunit
MSEAWLNALMIIEIVSSILLIVSILLQNRAEGLGRMFGGGGEVFRTRRGFENFLYYFTMFLAVVVAVLSFIIVKFTQ